MAENSPERTVRYWLYAPGAGAQHWDEFQKEGIMAMGWDELGDYAKYGSVAEVADTLRKQEDTTSSKKNDANAIFDMAKTIRVGDVIIVKRGRTEYLGYGVVAGDHYLDNTRPYFKNCRPVKWLKVGSWPEGEGDIAIKTLTDITKYPDYVTRLRGLIGIDDSLAEPYARTTNATQMHALNTILYGPPGTGKTYRTIAYAVSILEGKDVQLILKECDTPTGREQVRTRFVSFQQQGRVRLVTFHQSFSYEDFVESIKPDLEEEALSYRMEDGVLKRMAIEAAYEFVRTKETIGPDEAFLRAYDELLEEVLDLREKGRQFELKMRGGGSIEVVGFAKNDGLLLKHKTDKGNTYPILKSNVEKLYREIPDLKKVKNFYNEIGRIFGGGNASGYWAVLNYVKTRANDLLKSGAAPAQPRVASYEDKANAVQRINWSSAEVRSYTAPPYVLIIDEINRGNIASVFGELITLFESDKRLGNTEHLRVALPYSKARGESFGVPKNLYVLGTMNTADRSVEALDTALRRRFEFVECPSSPAELKNEVVHGVDLTALLSKLNARIEMLLNRDHHIGHSYFMNWAEKDKAGKEKPMSEDEKEVKLRAVFKKNIIPLLQEYFYGDPVKVGMVLGAPFVRLLPEKEVVFAQDFKVEDIDAKSRYEFIDPTTQDTAGKYHVPIAAFERLAKGE